MFNDLFPKLESTNIDVSPLNEKEASNAIINLQTTWTEQKYFVNINECKQLKIISILPIYFQTKFSSFLHLAVFHFFYGTFALNSIGFQLHKHLVNYSFAL